MFLEKILLAVFFPHYSTEGVIYNFFLAIFSFFNFFTLSLSVQGSQGVDGRLRLFLL